MFFTLFTYIKVINIYIRYIKLTMIFYSCLLKAQKQQHQQLVRVLFV